MKSLPLWLFMLFAVYSVPKPASAKDKPWKEVKYQDEVVILRPAENPMKNGRLFAEKDKTTYIIAGTDLGKTGEIAIGDFERYLPLASGCQTENVAATALNSTRNGFTILLATTKSSRLLNWAGLDYPKDLGKQECIIRPVKEFPDGTSGIALIGGSDRGLLNGVYTLLEKTADAWWEPVRILNPADLLYSNISETTLSEGDELRWTGGNMRWKPVVSDRIIYMGYTIVTKRTVDWASRNRMTHFVISTPHDLPMTEKEAQAIRIIIGYAHDRGLKVLFMNMTHRLPKNAPPLPASGEDALKLSTRLYSDQFQRFNLDGMTWHTASEGIHVNMDEKYKEKPRVEWEAKYFNAYYKAIRKVKEDATLAMLMGWVYMNPAEKLAELLPKDVIAWIVPYTPIIDASLTDLDSYTESFNHIWYWLYVTVSKDGNFPVVKTDYLEKYFREAVKRGHGLAPQAVLYNNNENAMYYAQSAREGISTNEEFLNSFGVRYYGDSQMGEALIKYQSALKNHRNWYDNIHTVDINYYFTFQEKQDLMDVYDILQHAAKNAKTPLIKNRLAVLTITTLRCLYRRSSPSWDHNDYLEMIKGIKSIFPDSYFGRENDFFRDELLKMESALNQNQKTK